MSIQDIVDEEIHKYKTDSVHEIIDYHDISIEYSDQLNKDCDSSILFVLNHAYITMKTDLDPLYTQFLLAHELGHYLLHYDHNISFHFLRKTKKNALEREANEFACRLLLYDIDIKNEENVDFIVQSKGIPLDIWYSVQDKICIKKL